MKVSKFAVVMAVCTLALAALFTYQYVKYDISSRNESTGLSKVSELYENATCKITTANFEVKASLPLWTNEVLVPKFSRAELLCSATLLPPTHFKVPAISMIWHIKLSTTIGPAPTPCIVVIFTDGRQKSFASEEWTSSEPDEESKIQESCIGEIH